MIKFSNTIDFLIIQIQQRAPIPKPKGNYVNIPKECNLSKAKHTEYQVNLCNFITLINYQINDIYI